jgi:hypothetical protein
MVTIFHPCLSHNVKIYGSCFNIQTTTALGVKMRLRKHIQGVHFIISYKLDVTGALSYRIPAKGRNLDCDYILQ